MTKPSSKSRQISDETATTNLGLELGLDQEMFDLFRATQTPEELEAEIKGIKQLMIEKGHLPSDSAARPSAEQPSTPTAERT